MSLFSFLADDLSNRYAMKRGRYAAKRVFPVVAMTGAMLTLGGLGLGLFAFLEIREPLPAQVQAVINPATESAALTAVGTSARAEPQLGLTESELISESSELPRVGDRLGSITMPSLDQSWPIFEGTDDEQLALGVGHYVGSVMPGMNDNSILSGHRTGVFKRLGELEINELILVQTELGTFTYQVRSFRVVDRADLTVIGPTPSAVLTLTTCYPFNSPTRTTDAFLVEADLVSSVLTPGPVSFP